MWVNVNKYLNLIIRTDFVLKPDNSEQFRHSILTIMIDWKQIKFWFVINVRNYAEADSCHKYWVSPTCGKIHVLYNYGLYFPMITGTTIGASKNVKKKI